MNANTRLANLVQKDDQDWKPADNDTHAIELLAYLTEPTSRLGVQVKRTYKDVWGKGDIGWETMLFHRDNLQTITKWATTLCKSASLAALVLSQRKVDHEAV